MADNKYLNLSGLQYFLRKLNEKKSDIESPVFTGTPKAPTPQVDDNSTNIATTAFVHSEVESSLTWGELGKE